MGVVGSARTITDSCATNTSGRPGDISNTSGYTNSIGPGQYGRPNTNNNEGYTSPQHTGSNSRSPTGSGASRTQGMGDQGLNGMGDGGQQNSYQTAMKGGLTPSSLGLLRCRWDHLTHP
eukprot:gnl/Chilomastix_caulleri/5101.p1 GENE.gnl/Chilomastix_caulleri/5101~~gnl/Chilomastix_caulleri/5101.p1  ORF type:complete len:119 (+),score=18.64 gnl/Chilomastix_caulleri/5101:1-357(+)